MTLFSYLSMNCSFFLFWEFKIQMLRSGKGGLLSRHCLYFVWKTVVCWCTKSAVVVHSAQIPLKLSLLIVSVAMQTQFINFADGYRDISCDQNNGCARALYILVQFLQCSAKQQQKQHEMANIKVLWRTGNTRHYLNLRAVSTISTPEQFSHIRQI